MLTVKKIQKKYAPLFNEFTSLSVNLDKNEATKLYILDEIIVACIHHAHKHL